MGEGEGEGGEHQVDGVHQGKDQEESGQNNIKMMGQVGGQVLPVECSLVLQLGKVENTARRQ